MARQKHNICEGQAPAVTAELSFAMQEHRPDPRLVTLIRFLARRAARDLYEQQLQAHDGRPRP